MSKSGEGIFVEASRKAGVAPSEAVFIANSPENLIVPNKMEMTTIYFEHYERDYDKLITQLNKVGVHI